MMADIMLIHRWLECRGQVKQLEQHNKSREQTDWLEELGLRLWKQSRTWSEAVRAESRTWKFWKAVGLGDFGNWILSREWLERRWYSDLDNYQQLWKQWMSRETQDPRKGWR